MANFAVKHTVCSATAFLIAYRWADGAVERAIEIVPEFARMPVDIIVTSGDAYVLAVKRAAATIPIVFASAGDPVGNGLVASLARPGGNVTGLSIELTDTVGKRLELPRVLSRPCAGWRSCLMPHKSTWNWTQSWRQPTRSVSIRSGRKCGLARISRPRSCRSRDVQEHFTSASPARVLQRGSHQHLASAARPPVMVMHSIRESPLTGGLMFYGPDFPDIFRRAAKFVDKILRGAKPADIQVEQPTKFHLVINLKNAKALGLLVPGTVLARADEAMTGKFPARQRSTQRLLRIDGR